MTANQQWRGRKKEHQWDYMGVDVETNAEYGYCDLCGGYREIGNGKIKRITKSHYDARVAAKKVEWR